MVSHYAYAVVGAGIEGSATAYYLAKNGFKTVLLEQFRLGHSRGSSHGCSRITRKCYDNPTYVHMMKRAYDLWDDLENESGKQLFKKTGLLFFATADGHELDKSREAMEAHNVPYTLLNHEEVRERYPNLNYDAGWKTLYDPDAGILKADRCLQAFQDRFIKLGGLIHDDDAVTRIESTGSSAQVITESGEQYSCDGVVVCVGAWAKSFLNKILGLTLPLQPLLVKACYWKVERKDLYSVKNNFPCILSSLQHNLEEDYYGLPSDEYPDLLKFCYYHGVNINHPDERDSVDASVCIDKPQRYVCEHFNYVQPRPAVVETCMFTITPDEHFILDTHPKYKNIVIGAGFSGHGFKFGPVVGEILGSLLLGRSTPYDLNMFRIGRFPL